jgi:hypothetical protein
MRSFEIQDGVKDGRQIPKYSKILMFAHICFHFCISNEIPTKYVLLSVLYKEAELYWRNIFIFLFFLNISKQNNAKRMGSCYDNLVYA